MNTFHNKINYLLLCIKYSNEFHILENNITINSSSQVGILNHLHLLPCFQFLILFKFYWHCLPCTFAPFACSLPLLKCNLISLKNWTIYQNSSLIGLMASTLFFPTPGLSPTWHTLYVFQLQSYSGYVSVSEPSITSHYLQTKIQNPFNDLYDHQLLATTKPSDLIARLFPSHVLSI